MKYFLPFVAAAILAPVASAQTVAEVAAMSVSHEVFDGDLLAAQPTVVSLSDINSATLSGNPLGLSNVTLTASTAALGVQSTNVFGAALGLDPAGSGSMMSAALGESFQAFNASIDLGGASTEFGMAISDYNGGFIFDFYSGGAFVATINSSAYGGAGAEDPKFFQMTGGTFDRVDVYHSGTGANWAIPAMFVESTGPSLAQNGTSGGVMAFDFAGFGPGETIAIVYGPGVAWATVAPCGPVSLDLTPLNFPPASALIMIGADANGDAQLVQNVPAGGAGLLVQGVGVSTCGVSNSVIIP